MSSDGPDREVIGNLVVVDSRKKISGVDRAPRLTGAQETDCNEILARLAVKWRQVFHPGGRVSVNSMRLDHQRQGVHNDKRCVITAIQNNLGEDEGGKMGRDHVFVYASVLIDDRAQAEEADTLTAMQRAYARSLALKTIFYIELAKEPAGGGPAPTTLTFVCPKCKTARTLPRDLIERARIEGCYPPRDTCPNLKCKGAEMVPQTTV